MIMKLIQFQFFFKEYEIQNNINQENLIVLFEHKRVLLIEVSFEVDNFLNGTKGN